MAIVRINELPTDENPSASDYIAVDGASTRKTTLEDAGNVSVPIASQAEAKAGTDPTKRMTPLTTKQAIDVFAVPISRQVNTGSGLTGGGPLTSNLTIALSSTSLTSLAKADSAVQPTRQVLAGTGMTGGGGLSADVTLSLSAATQASLNLADSSIQPGNFALMPAGGGSGQVLVKNSGSDYDIGWASIDAATAVSYAPQSLTSAQQDQARENIASASAVQGTKADNAVSFLSQALSEAQRLQASANIAAVSHDVQSLTTAQQQQARLNIGVVDIVSRAAMASVSIPTSYTYVRTAGYSTAGDNGAALYKKVASEPSHPGKVQSSDGAWWEITGVFFWPEQLGAKGDGVTDDTTAMSNLLLVCRSIGATVLIPAKTYITSTLTVENADHICGMDREKSVLKLPNGANVDVILGKDAYTLWATPTWGNFENGANRVTIENLTIDGNRANNPTFGNCIFIWGYGTKIRNVTLKNAPQNGLWTAFWDGNLPMEGTFENIIIDTCGQNGWLNAGPHDSHASNIIVVDASQLTDNASDGIILRANGDNGTNGRFFNCHVWHRSSATNRMRYALNVGSYGGNEFFGCHFEGGRKIVLVNATNNRFDSCHFYNCFGLAGTALVEMRSNANQFVGCRWSNGGTQLDTHAVDFYNNAAGNIFSGCYFSGFQSRTPFNFGASGGENFVQGRGFASGGGATTIAGAPHPSDDIYYYQGGTFINYRKPTTYGAYANDAGAAAAGVPVGGVYRNTSSNALVVRIT